jgi:hypothetical protein
VSSSTPAGALTLLLALLFATPRAQPLEYADADSADTVDEALSGVDPADFAEVTEALAENDFAAGGDGRGVYRVRAELVSGYRTSARLSCRAHGVALSLRRTADGEAQWIDIHAGPAWLERVTVGGLRVRAGRGLVLGARSARFAGRAPPDAGGVVAGPSLSLARPMGGAAATLRLASYRVTALGWSADGTEAASRGRWASVERRGRAGVVAVSAGCLRAPGVVWSIAANRSFDAGGSLAGELARAGDAVLASLGATVRAGGDWTIELYRGAGGGHGGVAAIASNDREGERGASVRWSLRGTTAAFYSSTYSDGDGTRLRRRVAIRSLLTGASGVRLDVSSRYDLDEETTVPAGALAERVEDEVHSRGRVGARLEVPVRPGLRLRCRTEARLEPGVRPGVISGVEVRRTGDHVDVQASVTNFALWTGNGYVSRPGIAGYDMVYAVTRRGSDVSARVRARLVAGVVATVYAGVPWDREPRYLLTVRWGL